MRQNASGRESQSSAGSAGTALNEAQNQAATHGEGPLLLLASPGSGKTTTMLMRIGYLIEEKGVQASRIKAVTFSKASAEDMMSRFARLFPALAEGQRAPDFSTIHSLAFGIVREHFRSRGIVYRLIEGRSDSARDGQTLNEPRNEPSKTIILRDLYRRLQGEYPPDDRLEELTRYIGFVKNKLVPLDRLSEVRCDVPNAEALFREYERYKLSGTDALLIDYDDMLTIAHAALAEDPSLRMKVQKRYDYVMTDESQDTSLVQHAILEHLVQGHGNLWVVADDDQSIYGWRAAEPGYLLDFKRKYPAARLLKLERNYRSTRSIVDVANRFIKRNKNRYDKNMFTERPDGDPITITVLPDYTFQAKYIVEKIIDKGRLGETAILYRNNSSSILLMNALDRAGIPFRIKDGDARFFSHWIVEDLLNFMRLTFNDRRADVLEKIHLKFNGYVSKRQMAQLLELEADREDSVFDRLLKHVPLQDYQVKPLGASRDIFRQMSGAPPREAIRIVRDRLGYDKAIEKTCERMGYRKEALVGILNALEEIAEPLETMEQFAARLKYLEARMRQSGANKDVEAVTLSTLHSSKGLEFSRVYMVDLVEGILPSADDARRFDKGDSAEMEEAARLFYVGMTRAKEELELLAYGRKEGEAVQLSRFVSEVRELQRPHADQPSGKAHSTLQPPPTPVAAGNPNAIRNPEALIVGARVRHPVFGDGEIILKIGDSVEIRFGQETKRLSANICVQRGLLEPSPTVRAQEPVDR
ncbi:ATP-dependent helicase [Cohnella boryungensis]|uniref:DNA 3'-5' helicase n=1 Tax=Cohnella boryungensis TaxID=768479 RepID=A0ABV8SES3_9BACL